MSDIASTPATVGVIANPLAGKDIRRLVAEASPTSDMAKIGIVRRAVIGAIEGGAERVILADDRRGIAARAIDGLSASGVKILVLDEPIIDSGMNSQRAARRCREEGAGAVIVLGGDGTHRDVAKGWKSAPLIALSTGTNNVFPRQIEATVAGHAAGLVASGRVVLADASAQAKCIEVEVESAQADDGGAAAGVTDDLALVDVALVSNTFTASRAVWDASTLRELVAAIAEPATVGLSAVAAALAPTLRTEPGGVHVRFGESNGSEGLDGAGGPASPGPDTTVRAPIAPGLYSSVVVASHRRLGSGEAVEVEGPGSLSFDGERDVTLQRGQRATMTITADGPHVIDVEQAMRCAAGTTPSKHQPAEND